MVAHAMMFQILNIGSQNISITTQIKAAKFSLKSPTRYEDINEIQNEFPLSGNVVLAKMLQKYIFIFDIFFI